MSFLPQVRDLTESRQRIARDFYRSFDADLALTLAADLSKTGEFLGEGRHFRSYRLRSRGSLDLVLNLAKPAFGLADGPKVGAWRGYMKALQRLAHPLLPPLEVLPSGEAAAAFVMPYCEEIIPEKSWDDLGLRALLETFEAELALAGLILDDYWQLRSCQGHPFVTDFSELMSLSSSIRRPIEPGLSSGS